MLPSWDYLLYSCKQSCEVDFPAGLRAKCSPGRFCAPPCLRVEELARIKWDVTGRSKGKVGFEFF